MTIRIVCRACLFIVLLVAAPVETEAQTGEPATFHACRVPDVGALYMIKASGTPEACLDASHVEFSWTEQGEQGPQGEPGPEGPIGPAGPQGPEGESGVDLEDIYAVGGSLEIAPGEQGTATADCPDGRRPISGFYSGTFLDIRGAGVQLGILNRFFATAENNRGAPIVLSVTASCVISP